MKNVIIICMLLFSLFDVALASVKLNTTSDGFVKFKAIGKPQLIKIHGESKSATGELQIVENNLTGRFELDLQHLKTGIELRDSHLKDNYLEIAKHPKAELILNAITVDSANVFTKKQSGVFTGQLQLHGVKKPIEGHYTLEPSGDQIAITTKWKITLSDFEIKIPTYLGVTVSKDVEIETSTIVKK
jgi:polyisoprenoid-binding protein YceI